MTPQIFRSLLVVSLLIAFGACNDQSESTAPSPGVFDQLITRGEFGSRIPPLYTSILEASPLIEYVVDGRPEFVSEALVVGRVFSVDEGRSFSWTDEGGNEVRTELSFNAKSAMVSTIHIQVAVDSAQARTDTIARGSEITIGLALNASVNVQALARELIATQGVVVYLRRSPVFDYDPKLWSVLDDGDFLGIVGEDSAVRFPILELTQPGRVPNGLTIDDLQREPVQQMIEVRVVDGDRVRVP